MGIAWIPALRGCLRPKCSYYYLTVIATLPIFTWSYLSRTMVWSCPGRHCWPWSLGTYSWSNSFWQGIHSGGSCPRYWGSQDRWSPWAGSRVSQRYLGAAGRHRTPGSWPLSSPLSLSFFHKNLLDAENVRILPLEGRASKGSEVAFLVRKASSQSPSPSTWCKVSFPTSMPRPPLIY